eukprot:1140181-Pelagomonas_calceolata.AAC.3
MRLEQLGPGVNTPTWAYELGWFALYQDLVFKLTPSKICHGHIAPDLRALWAREAAGHLSLVARYDEVGPVSIKA